MIRNPYTAIRWDPDATANPFQETISATPIARAFNKVARFAEKTAASFAPVSSYAYAA